MNESPDHNKPPNGYKQTGRGLLPNAWDAVLLGNLFVFKNGLNKAKRFFGTGTPIVNYMDVFRRSGLRTDDLLGRVNLNPDEIRNFEVRPGDVFFTRTSETVEEIGVASVMLDECRETVFSGFVLRARPQNDRLDHDYKKYCFSGREIRSQIVSSATYTTRALTNGRSLAAVWIAVPPKPEQRAIAEALSDVDRLLESLEALIAKKRAIKQASMQQLLTGKTRLPGFSGEWTIKRFGKVFRRLNGKRHQIQTSEYGPHGRHPVIDQGQNLIVAFSDQTNKLFKCPTGGVIVFGDHTRVVKFVDEDFLIGADGTQLLAMQERDVAKFFFYQLSTKDIPNTGYNRHFKFLKDLAFLIPTQSEQHAIVAVLSDMDAEIAALEQRRDKTRAIKQGMMQQLLTGRVRLVQPE